MPCYDPIAGKATGACNLSCDPGPKDPAVKAQPCCSEGVNAVRHGLTAETVVGSLEDAEDYKAFEATIIADYCAETAVARELVLRLASLLWRLRRATAIETDLLEIQAEALQERRLAIPQGPHDVVFRAFAGAVCFRLEKAVRVVARS